MNWKINWRFVIYYRFNILIGGPVIMFIKHLNRGIEVRGNSVTWRPFTCFIIDGLDDLIYIWIEMEYRTINNYRVKVTIAWGFFFSYILLYANVIRIFMILKWKYKEVWGEGCSSMASALGKKEFRAILKWSRSWQSQFKIYD